MAAVAAAALTGGSGFQNFSNDVSGRRAQLPGNLAGSLPDQAEGGIFLGRLGRCVQKLAYPLAGGIERPAQVLGEAL